MEFWKVTLGAPFKIVAPMVDASELPWRLLSRRHGAQLCYTPMLHSAIFCKDPKYRKEALATCEEDKPLIVQFCGNDAQTLLEAALLAQDHCSAIDINLGCPQAIAKRGHYGAFLQDEWSLLAEIVSLLNINKTIEYAKMLESSGCKMLTVHGRTREQKGPLTGLADWSYVAAVREAVKIPIVSNGNIQCMQDVYRCLEATGAVGVMTAEGNLYNPSLFECRNPPAWEPALEYLDLVAEYSCPFSYVRGHLFKLFQHVLSLQGNNEIRISLGSANTLDEFRRITLQLREMYVEYHEGKWKWEQTTELNTQNVLFPPWLCQSYVRLPPEEHLKKVEDKQKEQEQSERETKRRYEDADGNRISRKRMKKLRRISRRPEKLESCGKRSLDICLTCVNPLGSKCAYRMCKKCCKEKCFLECLDCRGHRVLVKTRREMAQYYSKQINVL